jgi:hypothetical protein
MKKVAESEHDAKNDEIWEGRKVRGKEEAVKVCFIAFGGWTPLCT